MENNLFIQEIFTLVDRKTKNLNYQQVQHQHHFTKINIHYDELIDIPSENLVLNSLKEISLLHHTWLKIKEVGDSRNMHVRVIDLVICTNTNLSFQISYYYLAILKKVDFNFEKFKISLLN